MIPIKLSSLEGLQSYQTWAAVEDLNKYKNFTIKVSFTQPFQYNYKNYDTNFNFLTYHNSNYNNLNYNLITFVPKSLDIINNQVHGYTITFSSNISLQNLTIQYFCGNLPSKISTIQLYAEKNSYDDFDTKIISLDDSKISSNYDRTCHPGIIDSPCCNIL